MWHRNIEATEATREAAGRAKRAREALAEKRKKAREEQQPQPKALATSVKDRLVKSIPKLQAVLTKIATVVAEAGAEDMKKNIPERQLFLQQAHKEALAPYFELTKCKRS